MRKRPCSPPTVYFCTTIKTFGLSSPRLCSSKISRTRPTVDELDETIYIECAYSQIIGSCVKYKERRLTSESNTTKLSFRITSRLSDTKEVQFTYFVGPPEAGAVAYKGILLAASVSDHIETFSLPFPGL